MKLFTNKVYTKLIGFLMTGILILNCAISSVSCIPVKAVNGVFVTYDLSETELRKIASLCQQEQGTARGAAAEASLMANLYELRGITSKSLYEYVRTCGWWNDAANVMDKEDATDAVYQAVKNVLTEGKRTVPGYVNEHDCFSDITDCQNNGVSFNKRDKSQYLQNASVIYNKYGAVYTFYCFPDTNSDPFGYTSENNRNRIGEAYYDFDTWQLHSQESVEPYITFSNYALPKDRLEPGAPFDLYGTISSYPNLNRVWGGVYNSDGTPTAEFVDFNPSSAYCDIAKDIDLHIIFNHLDVGYYTYKIEATNEAGVHEEIHSNFRVGDPSPSKITISEATSPSGELPCGAFWDVRGIITSSNPLTKVWGGVYHIDGTPTEQYYETEVNSISYDLSEVFDHRLLFDALPEGNYTYSIYAADNKGFSDEVIRSVFSVVSTMSSSITITGESYPTGSLEPGKSFGIYGKIASTYPLTRVWGGVYYLDGTPTAQYCDKNPNWTTFDLLKQLAQSL